MKDNQNLVLETNIETEAAIMVCSLRGSVRFPKIKTEVSRTALAAAEKLEKLTRELRELVDEPIVALDAETTATVVEAAKHYQDSRSRQKIDPINSSRLSDSIYKISNLL